MFRNILVANRGEIALRIITSIQKLGARAIVVYSVADKEAPYLKVADASVCIGPGPAHQSYLNQDAILQAAIQNDCQAIHPGFGFLAENATFAKRCEQQKLTFIGPSARHIALMGDKASARRTMKRLGVPVIPGADDVATDFTHVKKMASQIGYPVLLKATAGGGGKGMRIVHTEKELKQKFEEASMEALKAFGNAGIYVEKFFTKSRHIEFQILADNYGNVVHLGERECSIQRNHQKLLEESPAFGMSNDVRREIGKTICDALGELGYQNAGTIEFLMAPDGNLYFMEMNTRLQVEHPVTELVSGIDIVEWQIKLASGQKLELLQDDLVNKGHAIECRINAEDPDDGFKPCPGVLSEWLVPKNSPLGPLRIDSHVTEGYKIPTLYDSMVAKVIVHGKTRREAISIMKKSLKGMKVGGVKTTLPLHRAIMDDAKFGKGGYDCAYLEESGLLRS